MGHPLAQGSSPIDNKEMVSLYGPMAQQGSTYGSPPSIGIIPFSVPASSQHASIPF